MTEFVPCTFSSSIPTSRFLINLSAFLENMHMYKLENAITPEHMSDHKSFLWDTIHFEWHSMCLHMNGQPANLPSNVTILLKDKVRARWMLAKEDLDLQFMIKLGSNCIAKLNSADSVYH